MSPGSKKKLLIIVNTKASKYDEKLFDKRLDRILSGNNISVEVYYFYNETKMAERINRAIREGTETFVAAGGDGTVALVGNHLKGKNYPIGIIPVGTTNSLAQVLGVPLSMSKAMKVAFSSTKTITIDGLEVNDKLYFMNTSIGLSSYTIRNISDREKALLGSSVYVLSAARLMPKIKLHTFFIDIDQKTQQVEAAEIFITNTGVLGSPQFKISDSQLSDGKLELLMLQKTSIGEIFNASLDVFIRRRRKRGVLYAGQCERITIRCDEPLPVQADGDIIGQSPVTVTIIPKSTTFIVP